MRLQILNEKGVEVIQASLITSWGLQKKKRSRDKSLKFDLTLYSGEHVEMAHDDIGKKIDLILSNLEAVNLKLESISAVVKNLEKNLNKVKSRVEGRH